MQGLILPAFVVMAILLVWIALQSLSFDGNPFANAIWAATSALSGAAGGAISVAPADTIATAAPIALPFATFIAGVLLFDDDEKVIGLLAYLVAVATIGAIIGIIQLNFFPNSLLFFEKQFYLDSLTAYFVNRNTTGTYLAIHLIAACGLTFHYAQALGREGLGRLLDSDPGYIQPGIGRLILCGSAVPVILVALLLTKSRAGLGAGMIGLALFGAILVYYGPSRKMRHGWRSLVSHPRSRVYRWMRVVVLLAGCGILVWFLGGRALLRASAVTGDERFCVLPGIVRLLADNWVFGTGFGTFLDVFPAYRPSSCLIDGIWDRAHNFYLEAWIVAGVIAPILILGVISWLVWKLVVGIRSRKGYRWMPVAGSGMLLTVVLHAAVDFSPQITGFSAVFAAMMAGILQVSTLRLGRDDNRRRSRTRLPDSVSTDLRKL